MLNANCKTMFEKYISLWANNVNASPTDWYDDNGGIGIGMFYPDRAIDFNVIADENGDMTGIHWTITDSLTNVLCCDEVASNRPVFTGKLDEDGIDKGLIDFIENRTTIVEDWADAELFD